MVQLFGRSVCSKGCRGQGSHAAVAIKQIHKADLFDGWRGFDAREDLQKIGDDWLHNQESAVLGVPSAVIPAEYNYLINPYHPDFSKIDIRKPAPFNTDQRLLRP
ncbi:MAG: RES family NAD+ phosphorylase [Methylophilaceae bacterium]